LTVLVRLAEVLSDPVGALLPIIGAGLVLGADAASAELGVTKALAVPDPPVIEKYVEKTG